MLPLVVQGNREHSSKLFDAVRTHLLIKVDDDFGIGMGVKPMPATLQIFPQFAKVVDLSVENYGDAAVLVVDRLTPP